MPVSLVTSDQKPPIDETLEIVDALRKDVTDGIVTAVAAVALSRDGGMIAYTAASETTSRLRLIGAITRFLHDYIAKSP